MRSFRIAGIVLKVVLTAAASSVSAFAEEKEPLVLESFSEGSGAPLVMLGGGTLGAAEFEPHAHALAGEFRVIRLQTLNIERAQKREPLPSDYSVKTESAAMARALDLLGVTTAVDVVGHSFGALIALDFALDHPDRIRTLVLAEPPAFWVVPPQELRAISDMRAMYELCLSLGPNVDPTDGQLVSFLALLGNSEAKPPAQADSAWANWIFRRSALRGLSVVAKHNDQIDRLKDLRKPVLIVTGSNTVSFHRRIDELLANDVPNAEKTEIPGGHGAPASAKTEFLFAITQFYSRHH